MKNMMYLALLMFLIQIGCFSTGHCKDFLPMDSHLIDQTCRKTPNPTLCVSSLKSDPHSSASADVSGLALIMVGCANQAITTGNPKFAEQAMNEAANEANSCEDEFSRGSPLTYENKAVADVAGVASAIVRILL
ncbi:hypothetical protein M0R45_016506 [Rubus argutus]|uniref:Pectinesterase inhibitor domain-containing protein n=1 Tax=Rubus argutus TaxID=59490 RepID=A0AAW1XSP4_RUBAR